MMVLFDRFTQKDITEKELPDQIDFGRFLIKELDAKPVELTYSTISTSKHIRQEILLEKNKSLQDVFIDIGIDVEKCAINKFEVIPLIKRIKNKLALNDFESMLNENVFHLEEIFRQPHYLLDREIEKVHVSRAKRIPSKSYQYLASHTEDWIHKSIVNFKPSRVLNEELNLNFDIYENELAVSFLDRCLSYLNSRLKEIQDMDSFLSEYKKLLENRNDARGWYKKIERNLKLIGSVYEDGNNSGQSSDSSILSETEKILSQLNKRLLILRKSDLYFKVKKRGSQTISLKNTNVLINHKHYRYLKSLWVELGQASPEKSDKEKGQYEQDIYKGIQGYAVSLIVYSLKEYLKYQPEGDYTSFIAKRRLFPSISVNADENGIINLKIGTQNLKLIVLGNEPADMEILTKIMGSQKAYILFFSEQVKTKNKRAIHINPLDPDSCERISSFLRQYIIKNYLENLNKEYEFARLLRDCTEIFPEEYIVFDKANYSYRFTSCPVKNINIAEIEKKLVLDGKFKSIKSRFDKDRIRNQAAELANQINNAAEKLKTEYLYCISCGNSLSFYTTKSFDRISCDHCQFSLRSFNKKSVVFKNTDSKYECLSSLDWGMDYLNFDIETL